jgi:hypothetical protein
MKTLRQTLLVIVAVVAGCQRQQRDGAQVSKDRRVLTALDSAPLGRNVAIVRPKEAATPAEVITDFSRLSNIMENDIDALRRTPSKGVVYVRPGESVRPLERQ